jgi:hypothetical protein
MSIMAKLLSVSSSRPPSVPVLVARSGEAGFTVSFVLLFQLAAALAGDERAGVMEPPVSEIFRSYIEIIPNTAGQV